MKRQSKWVYDHCVFPFGMMLSYVCLISTMVVEDCSSSFVSSPLFVSSCVLSSSIDMENDSFV